MTPQMTRQEWLAAVQALMEPVGECIEWQGRYIGKTPCVYVPRGYAWPGNSQAGHSARAVVYALHHGKRLRAGQIVRARCGNSHCVNRQHFMMLTRCTQAAEQGRRGELSTPRRRAVVRKRGRERAKLNESIVQAIRASALPERELAALHGVSRATIGAVRRGRLWPAVLPGASVFGWGGAAAPQAGRAAPWGCT